MAKVEGDVITPRSLMPPTWCASARTM